MSASIWTPNTFVASQYGRTPAEILANVTPTNYEYYTGDVRRYGALVDGTTDDADAIDDALAVFAAGGVPVYLPGMCYVSRRIEYSSSRGLQMYGDGWHCGLKGEAAGSYIILFFQGAAYAAINGVHLSEFSIDGNNGGQLDAGLLQLNNCTGFLVDHVQVGNTTKASGSSGINGITASAGTPGGAGPSGVIRSSRIYSTSKAGVNWTSESVGAVIEDTDIEDITGNGTAPGIQVNGGAGARLISNRISRTQGPGVYINVDSLGNPPLDTIVSDNVIKDCGGSSLTEGDGIRITAASSYSGRIIASNNSVSGCGTATNGGSGIFAINTKNIVLDGNICDNNAYDGIRLQGCASIAVTGGRVTGNNRAGASFAGGIQILGTCSQLSIIGVNGSDDKASKTQSYGIILNTSATLNSLTIEANHLEGNLVGPMLLNQGAIKMRLSFVAEKQTTDGSAQTLQYITLPDVSALSMYVKAIGKKTDGSDCAMYTREGLFYRAGGTATQQGATTTLGSDIESNAAWGGLTFGVSANLALAQVTGVAATTIDWRAEVTVQTV
jgi:parallel beta-helix repeat protein